MKNDLFFFRFQLRFNRRRRAADGDSTVPHAAEPPLATPHSVAPGSATPQEADPDAAAPQPDRAHNGRMAVIAARAALNDPPSGRNNRLGESSQQPSQPGTDQRNSQLTDPRDDHRVDRPRDDHWGDQSRDDRRVDQPRDDWNDPGDAKRRQVLLSGELIYADTQASALTCLVLELCPAGARVETDQAARLPAYLFFRIGTGPLRPVCLIHRQGNCLELGYLDVIEAGK